jgi:hypothetical protein
MKATTIRETGASRGSAQASQMRDRAARPRPQSAPDGRKQRTGHGAKGEATRERAVIAVLSERTVAAAARQAGVGERTLRRWMAEDHAFQVELQTARRAAFENGISRVQALTTRAVEALDDLLTERDHPSVRLGAARTIVELAMHQRDADILLKRLKELEAQQRTGQPIHESRRR